MLDIKEIYFKPYIGVQGLPLKYIPSVAVSTYAIETHRCGSSDTPSIDIEYKLNIHSYQIETEYLMRRTAINYIGCCKPLLKYLV